jgi:ankyrin repeat protein
LLEAGADPNDGQALYNRQFGADNDHLELLFEYGLGSDRGGPWYVRLGDALETPNALVQRQLRWAAQHGLVTRVRLLLEHGVDVAAPLAGGRTATELAALAGHADVVDLLMIHGAAPPHLAPVEAVVAAVLASDRAAIDRLVAEHPGVVDQARRVRPGLVAWATAVGRSDAVRLAVELGWDVDARGCSDAPIEMARETALHVAAAKGDPGLTRLLLSLGADPNVRDARFDATPLGWARHFENETLVEVLEPLTKIPPDTA